MSIFPGKDGAECQGVFIERRQLVWVSLGTLVTLAVNSSLSTWAAQAAEVRSRPAWDALFVEAMSLAERLTQSKSPDEEAYLKKLSGLIGEGVVPKASFDLTQAVATHETSRRFPLLVVQFRLAPHAVIPYHDHRDYIGVLTVTEGSLHVRSFDIVGKDRQPARDSTFRIRESHAAVLTRGSQSTLSRTRDNIHHLRAGPEGARLIDFFTMFQPGAHSVYLNVDEQPTDPVHRIFEARWA